MARATLCTGLRLLTVLAVILSALAVARAVPSLDHIRILQMVETAANAGVADMAEHAHSHSHDDEPGDGTLAAHGHEHKDHSHITFGLPAAPAALIGPDRDLLHIREQCGRPTGLPFRLDRPPCVLTAA
jgi:hypothetical protein